MLNILVKNISKRLPDARHHQVKYALYFKKLPHLSKPTGFSEKIMRRKIYPRSIYTTLSDKFKVREFIAGLWGEEYLVELYAHGTELSYDMFRQLPNAFVLKANHGSGYNRLVFDKRQVSYAELYDLSNAWMRSNFYEQSREKHYLDIEPCIMVERLLLDGEQVPNDIKFHCFNDNHEIRMFIGGLSAFRHSSARYFRYRLEPHRNPYQLAECRRTDAAPYAAGRNDAFGSPGSAAVLLCPRGFLPGRREGVFR